MRTPVLPDWIREATVSGYESAHRICPDETRLYGTESLFGDWRARVLVLAKVFGPTALLHERRRAGDLRPYRHAPEWRSNRRIAELAAPLRAHGLLYGSALANLLRTDGRARGALPNRAAALEYAARATRFAIEHMPNLQLVLCLGREAWEAATAARGLEGDWQRYRDGCEPLDLLVAGFHPSARVPGEFVARPFELAAHLLG